MHGEEKMENGASVRPSFRPYILCSFNHYFILLILLFILTFFIPLFCTADSICWLNLSAASQQYFHSVTETLRTFLSSTSSYPSAHPVVHRLTCMDSTNFLSNGWKRRQNGENSALLLLGRQRMGGWHYHWTFVYFKRNGDYYELVNRSTACLPSSLDILH